MLTRAELGIWTRNAKPAAMLLPAAGVAAAVLVAIALSAPSLEIAIPLVIAAIAVLVAIWSPYWGLVATIAQYAVLPNEGYLFGHLTPNLLQFMAPLIVISALSRALRDRDKERLRLRVPDVLVAVFGLGGLIGRLVATPDVMQIPKWYINRMLLPMVLYYATRLIPIKHKQVRLLVMVLLVFVCVQSVLMIRESMAGHSPLYGKSRWTYDDIKAAKGPFYENWNAAAFLALWPALLLYAMASAGNRRQLLLWGGGLLSVLGAVTRTMERTGIAASVLSMVFCLSSPKLRRTTMVVLCLSVLVYIPWSMTGAGHGLIGRFQSTDQSRYAYRTAAINILRSSKWNPVLGIGWGRFDEVAPGMGTEERVLAWGTRAATVNSLVSADTKLHNVWLAIPLEMGLVGALCFVGLIGCLLFAVRRIRAAAKSGVGSDDGLLSAVIASMIAFGAIGYFQNVYMFAESLCVFWVFYALIVGHPDAFLASEGTPTDEGTSHLVPKGSQP
jgi:putative inorganic carbon (hco3(-)) transporter